MDRSLSSFDPQALDDLLHRAGASSTAASPPNRPTPPRAPAGQSSAPMAAAAPTRIIDRVKAVPRPSERALGAALETLLADLHRVLGAPLFVADSDGLLLAGTGDAPALAASMAADALRSLHATTSVTVAGLDALLLRADPHSFLVFNETHGNRSFVVGARVDDTVVLDALRLAVERIRETLFLRTPHA